MNNYFSNTNYLGFSTKAILNQYIWMAVNQFDVGVGWGSTELSTTAAVCSLMRRRRGQGNWEGERCV